MSNYVRVLPRDLFNEAGLLKMMGRLWILLSETRGHNAEIVEEDVPRFDIQQDESSGAIYVANVRFLINGVERRLSRPLNSRSSWSFWMTGTEDDPDFDEIAVFDENGNFTADMRSAIGLPNEEA